MLPTWENYGRYSSDNYGAHTLRFIDKDGDSFWFSYNTLVAFKIGALGPIVRENEWGSTTGKHLNWIDGGDKKSRVSAERFKEMLTKASCFKPSESRAAYIERATA